MRFQFFKRWFIDMVKHSNTIKGYIQWQFPAPTHPPTPQFPFPQAVACTTFLCIHSEISSLSVRKETNNMTHQWIITSLVGLICFSCVFGVWELCLLDFVPISSHFFLYDCIKIKITCWPWVHGQKICYFNSHLNHEKH